MWAFIKSRGSREKSGCLRSSRRRNKAPSNTINVREIFIREDYQAPMVAETPKFVKIVPSIPVSEGEPAPTLNTLDTLTITSGSRGSLLSRPLDDLITIQEAETSSQDWFQPALRRRHTLPVLSEFHLHIKSQKSFSSSFEEFPNFFTADATVHESSDSESFVTADTPRQLYRQQSFYRDISSDARTRTGRAKSMGFITTSEKPKLIAIPRRESETLKRDLAVEAPTTDSTPMSTIRLAEFSGSSPNTSIGSQAGNSMVNLDKPLPSLPRPHQKMYTMKKRLSRIFRLESRVSMESIISDSAGAAEVYPSNTMRARLAGIVGKKIQLWEGMTAITPSEPPTEARQQALGHHLVTDNFIDENGLDLSAWATMNTDRDNTSTSARRSSIPNSSSSMIEDSEMTIIVRPECASASFEKLQLISRPASLESLGELYLLPRPATPENCPNSSRNRLVRSPRYHNLRKEVEPPQSTPSTPTPRSRYRKVRSVSWIGNILDDDVNDPRSTPETFHPARASIDFTTISTARHSRHYSFHMNYNDFMDESLNRYGRSGFGGRMLREVPISDSMQFITNGRESRIDPRTERMIEIWGDVSVSVGGTILC